MTLGITGGACREVMIPVKFTRGAELATPDNSNVFHGIDFKQEFCWNGSQAWLGRQPQHRAYQGPYGYGRVTVTNCTYDRSDSVAFRRSDFALSTCDIDVINGAGGSLTAGISLIAEVTGTLNILAGQRKYYYDMKFTPNGCVYLSGVNRSSAIQCFS
ncbi:MAG: hypothetical protein OHK0022_41720 [Roseiflexaceae bacterium]